MPPKMELPKTILVHVPKTQYEAAGQFFGSLLYWVTHFWQPLCAMFLLLMGINVYQLQDWLKTSRAKVETVENHSPSAFSLMPTANAAEKDSVVVVNGKTFYVDTNFICYKIRDDDRVLVYDKILKGGVLVSVHALRKDNLQKMLK